MRNNKLGNYSFGVGDRFAHQARAQLSAFQKAKSKGADITPVWNKSYREHTIIKSKPVQTRQEADKAVQNLNWESAYFVDADHVNAGSVGFFLDSSDFFTLDVADFIGTEAAADDISAFISANREYLGKLKIPEIEDRFEVDETRLQTIALKYLNAVMEAGKIYRKIKSKKNGTDFIVEVSMDETDTPQSPLEIFFILSALRWDGVPVDTLAPKFSGRFNKGVDYVGDVERFRKEFEQDLAVIGFAINEFAFSPTLKLSVHSGSDKFSLYPVIKQAISKADSGLHIKTAGTTWLEELIGLALSGGEGLQIAKEVYRRALGRYDELCSPYATVIDIDKKNLPPVETVNSWQGGKFAAVLRHDRSCTDYNPDVRQLLHVGYKIAAEMGDQFLHALQTYEETIAEQVTTNIFERHMKPLFL